MWKFMEEYLFLFSVIFYGSSSAELSENAKIMVAESTLANVESCRHMLQSADEGLLEDIDVVRKLMSVANNECFLACLYKRNGIIDSRGMYVLKEKEKYLQFYIDSDAEILYQASKKCLWINQVFVTDAYGCQRASLLYNCLKAHLICHFEDDVPYPENSKLLSDSMQSVIVERKRANKQKEKMAKGINRDLSVLIYNLVKGITK